MRKLIFIIVLLSFKIESYTQTLYPDIVFETTMGEITIRLYDSTTLHSQNFLKLVNEGYYNGHLFHRVIKNFMIQSGDPNSINATPSQPLGTGGPNYLIPAEFKQQYFHKKGALAAARQGDPVNPEKKSSGSQFYIVHGQVFTLDMLEGLLSSGKHLQFTEEQLNIYTTIGGTPHLDNEYTVFGEVINGLDIIDKIAEAAVDRRSRPIDDIRIIKAYKKK